VTHGHGHDGHDHDRVRDRLQCSLFLSLLYKRVLYCEVVTLWRYEVVNKHHTEGSGKATPPVCRYSEDEIGINLRIPIRSN